MPFPKFFNYGEVSTFGYETLTGGVNVMEKLDGSLGIVYFHDGVWNCATKGSFDSTQAIWGKAWLNDNLNTSELIRGHTYLFELVYSDNQIVVKYEYEGMILLSAYSSCGIEYERMEIEKLANSIGTRAAETYEFSGIPDLLKRAAQIDRNNEGWVLRFANGHKLKIKGDEYCRIHRLISNVTPLGVWDLIRNNDDILSIRKELPEEHLADFDHIVRLIDLNLKKLICSIEQLLDKTSHLSDKEVGMCLAKKDWGKELVFNHEISNYLFPARKNNLLSEYQEIGKWRDKLFKHIRPTGNKLEGYVASGAINRFNDEC